ncbi:chitinase domain-containing protein 1 [Contarinia nasturtii]|uniref:chitinase domain-containing protein 1 n=1 Tax=Contarinia nasturtii TaxID=265458 RepID=UPI0012D47A5F|nr:chitinase domain-containing protein 1 [Contarinia nasturtii]
MKFHVQSSLIVILSCVLILEATLAPPDKNKKSKPAKELKINKGPVDRNVHDRNLVIDEPTSESILKESATYYKNTSARLFDGPTLGFVTPWNNHGYNVAKTFGSKFDIISPVWLQVLHKGKHKYEIGGTHDVDAKWIQDVRRAGPPGKKVLPRVMFEKFSENDFSHVLMYESARDEIAELLVQVCKNPKHKFDGIVLEVWFQLAGRVQDKHLLRLVEHLAKVLQMNNLMVVLVVPPLRDQMDFFTQKHFEALYPLMSAFALVTYDYSNIERPGANSPIKWIRRAVEHICPDTIPNYLEKRQKVLIGMNMYGMDYTLGGGGPITGRQFLDLLKMYKGSLNHAEEDEENYFEFKKPSKHLVFYPTLYSINKRIELAKELNTGLSLWEIGQGLEYFYDLF